MQLHISYEVNYNVNASLLPITFYAVGLTIMRRCQILVKCQIHCVLTEKLSRHLNIYNSRYINWHAEPNQISHISLIAFLEKYTIICIIQTFFWAICMKANTSNLRNYSLVGLTAVSSLIWFWKIRHPEIYLRI